MEREREREREISHIYVNNYAQASLSLSLYRPLCRPLSPSTSQYLISNFHQQCNICKVQQECFNLILWPAPEGIKSEL